MVMFLPILAPNSCAKAQTNCGVSSVRSRKGGMVNGKTLSRYAKPTLTYLLGQVPVGSGYDADISFKRLGAADPAEFPLLEIAYAAVSC